MIEYNGFLYAKFSSCLEYDLVGFIEYINMIIPATASVMMLAMFSAHIIGIVNESPMKLK